ncbi:hypothetical protein JCM3766R1_004823 [Sporobolomyces carnicolor]
MATNQTESINTQLDILDRTFLASLSGKVSLAEFNRAAQEAWHRISCAIEQGQLDLKTIQWSQRVAARIRTVATGLSILEEDCDRIIADSKERFRIKISELSPVTLLSSAHVVRETSKEQPDPFLPLRLWFIDNFANPYPDAKTKDRFLRMYPTHTKIQLDTWFTNIRRRSGWQDLRRRYARGMTSHFVQLIKETEQETRSPFIEEARLKIEKVKLYLREGVREKISDEILEIVEQGAPSTRTHRIPAPRQSRKSKTGGGGGLPNLPNAPSSTNSFNFDHFQLNVPNVARLPNVVQVPLRNVHSISDLLVNESSPAPFSFDSYEPSVVESPSSISPPQLSPGPRYPSSFSSPTSSLRSVADSSSSSFDSVLSYDSQSSFASQSPSSPPASSSLANFDSPARPRRTSNHQSPARSAVRPRARPVAAPIENPYFFTLNNTPLLSLPAEPADLVVASSSLAGFASNGDLRV